MHLYLILGIILLLQVAVAIFHPILKNIKINAGSGSDIATNNVLIISDPLSGRVSQRQEVDLVRDPVAKLSSKRQSGITNRCNRCNGGYSGGIYGVR
mmetsp:Transcript_12318/g.12058  ORF Transcript_12318/g.12058 Transcript_12318/m.12058 type:complete len:97 (-) Transcript_12318:179-469(-)